MGRLVHFPPPPRRPVPLADTVAPPRRRRVREELVLGLLVVALLGAAVAVRLYLDTLKAALGWLERLFT